MQFGHHQIDKLVERLRQHRRHDVEAVAGTVFKPFLHPVGNGLWRADHHPVAARTGQVFVQLAHGEFVAPGQLQHHVGAAVDALGRLGDVGRRGVQVPLRQVFARPEGHQRGQAHAGVDQRLQLGPLGLGFFLGAANHGGDAGQHQQLLGAAAIFGQAALHVLVERFGLCQARPRGEDGFGAGGGQLFAIFRRACLHDHRVALRWALDVQRAFHLQVLADVVERVQLVGVKGHAAGFVAREGVVVKAVPQALDHIDEFMRFFIAGGGVGVGLVAKIAIDIFGAGGDHVPGGTALADVVERGEFARQQKRVFVGGGGGGDKADVLGDGGQRRPQRHGLEVRDAALAAEGFFVALVPDAGAVGHKHLVEQAALCRLRQGDVVVDIDPGVGLRAGVAPGGNVVARGHDEGAQAQLALGGGHRVFLRCGVAGAARVLRRFAAR